MNGNALPNRLVIAATLIFSFRESTSAHKFVTGNVGHIKERLDDPELWKRGIEIIRACQASYQQRQAAFLGGLPEDLKRTRVNR